MSLERSPHNLSSPPNRRENKSLVEAERGLSAGALCGARTQPVGTGVQMRVLESEAVGQFERRLKHRAWNTVGPVETGQKPADRHLALGQLASSLLL